MEQEERTLLERTAALAEENNKILKKMQRMNRLGTIVHIVYWVILAGVAVGAFYFLQPYIDSVRDTYGSLRNAVHRFAEIGTGTTTQE